MGPPIRIAGINSEGESGQFRANEEVIGWRRDDGGRQTIFAVDTVRRAEWLEGKLRLLCEVEGESQVLALDGFPAKDYDLLWKHFEQYCGVYIKKHRPQASLSGEDFDAKMMELEAAADQVDEASAGSVVKQAREADLLKKVEVVRDGLDKVIAGDKHALSQVFAANGCERIGRLRLVLRTVQVEFYRKDARFTHLKHIALSIESVLQELGAFQLWRPSEDAGQSNILKRQMVWELRKRQGYDDELEEEEEIEPQPPKKVAAPPSSNFTQARDNVNQLAAALGGAPPAGLAPAGGPLGGPHGGPLGGAPVGSSPPPKQEEPKPEPPPKVQEPPAPEPAREPSRGTTVPPPVPTGWTDEEVKDPNLLPAAPKGEGRNPRYFYPDSVQEGWVWKQSRLFKRWRRRYVVLTPQNLATYKQRGDLTATESVLPGEFTSAFPADAEAQQSRAFCVAVMRRSYYMVCDDEEVRDEWVKNVKAQLGGKR
jgi:hypothetical protein